MPDILTKFRSASAPSWGRQPAVWRDRNGALHRAVGADVHDGIRLLWTACGRMDIPANAAWLQRDEDEITCAECRHEECDEHGSRAVKGGDGE